MSNASPEQGTVTEFGAHLAQNIEWGTLPEPVSWMPATTAWYVLLGLVFLSILGYLLSRYVRWLKASYLRQAEDLLEQYIQTEPYRIGHLVKRVANQRWPERNAGVMNSSEFASFLHTQQGENALSKPCCEALFQATYKPSQALSELHIADVKLWLGAIDV